MKRIRQQSGYITLMSVLVVGTIAVAVATSLLFSSILVSKNDIVYVNSTMAQVYVDSCIEEALQQIRNSTPYTGTETVSFTGGTCTYTVINDGGQNRTINASSTVGLVMRKSQAIVNTINPNIQLTSWEDKADF